jgi:hypothetical protein
MATLDRPFDRIHALVNRGPVRTACDSIVQVTGSRAVWLRQAASRSCSDAASSTLESRICARSFRTSSRDLAASLEYFKGHSRERKTGFHYGPRLSRLFPTGRDSRRVDSGTLAKRLVHYERSSRVALLQLLLALVLQGQLHLLGSLGRQECALACAWRAHEGSRTRSGSTGFVQRGEITPSRRNLS